MAKCAARHAQGNFITNLISGKARMSSIGVSVVHASSGIIRCNPYALLPCALARPNPASIPVSSSLMPSSLAVDL